MGELIALQAEYAAWWDALPDSLHDTATAGALQAIVELDLDELAAIVPRTGTGETDGSWSTANERFAARLSA